MSKFILTDEAPKELGEGEIVITMPDFVDEIKDAEKFASKLGGRRVTTLYHLKSIATNIGIKYDPEGFNPVSDIPYSLYEGLAYESYEELSGKILKMFTKHYPAIVDKYLDNKIKGRPKNTKTIYFVGDESKVQVFLNNGLDRDDSQPAKAGNKKTVKKENTTKPVV